MYPFILMWALAVSPGAPAVVSSPGVLNLDSSIVRESKELPTDEPTLAPSAVDRSWPLLDLPDLPTVPSAGSTTSVPSSSSAGSDALALRLRPSPNVTENPDFQWQPAVREAAAFTGIMHAWRFSTERGTRDALRGPFFADWFHSIGEFRGWDDGDTFVTSYVAHPMEGAIFGFIQQENDPRYRAVQLGDGRAYWVSRLHALAFATMMSTQWTLGPASEASLGNTNLYASPGFVDLAGTPTLGVGWMIGEDVIDRYMIAWLEGKTANPYVLAVARGLGNPTRSFANIVALKVPWHRETRPGLFRENEINRQELIANGGVDPYLGFVDGYAAQRKLPEDPGIYPLEAPIELMATTHYERLGDQNCYGGGGTGAARVNAQWQVVAEITGCLITGFPKDESGDSLAYMVGPRWAPRAAKRISPFGQFLLGGRRVTHEILNATLRTLLLNQWNEGDLAHYPMRSAYSVEHQANGFALAAGGGFDVRLTRAMALRVADLEYTHSWLPAVDSIHASEGVRFSAGLVLRIGTW